ncbi:hypothetical protein HK105_203773 [Polyrhizophydium stewartii]|uniref:Uncharacterized protein n=1 Tax=Polyrhizophydium stewartii TaxID=2732419 RepID=A0ABR4NAW7_9FUNG
MPDEDTLARPTPQGSRPSTHSPLIEAATNTDPCFASGPACDPPPYKAIHIDICCQATQTDPDTGHAVASISRDVASIDVGTSMDGAPDAASEPRPESPPAAQNGGQEEDQEIRNMCFLENMRLERELEEAKQRILQLENRQADEEAALHIPISLQPNNKVSIPGNGVQLPAEMSRPPLPPGHGAPSTSHTATARPPLYPSQRAAAPPTQIPHNSDGTTSLAVSSAEKLPVQNAIDHGSDLPDNEATPFCQFHSKHIAFLETLLAQTCDKLEETKIIYERRCSRLKQMLTKEKTESTIRIFELESQVACHVRRSDIARGAELVGYSIETMVEPDTSDVAGGQLPGQPAMLPPLSATLDGRSRASHMASQLSRDLAALHRQLESKDELIKTLSMQIDLAAKISAEIDKQIEKDRQAMIKAQEEPRLLILGSSDSGKTTLLKQLKILHGGGFIDAEKDQYRIQMAANCLDSIKTLISGVDKLAIPREAEIMRFELPKSDTAAVPQNIVGAIEQTWASAHIQAAWKQANKLQVQDTADFFLDRVRTVLDPEYKLTNEDILQCRFPTSQVTEFRFTVGSTMFHFFDVGGMIHQRKQWISYFDNVDLLPVSIILFLNKRDAYEKKIQSSPIAAVFPEFKDKSTPEAGIKFLRKKFTSLPSVENRGFVTHVTTCTDTKSMKVIVGSVIDAGLRAILKSTGYT